MRQIIAAAIFVIATMVTPPDWIVSDEIGPRPGLDTPSELRIW